MIVHRSGHDWSRWVISVLVAPASADLKDRKTHRNLSRQLSGNTHGGTNHSKVPLAVNVECDCKRGEGALSRLSDDYN